MTAPKKRKPTLAKQYTDLLAAKRREIKFYRALLRGGVDASPLASMLDETYEVDGPDGGTAYDTEGVTACAPATLKRLEGEEQRLREYFDSDRRGRPRSLNPLYHRVQKLVMNWERIEGRDAPKSRSGPLVRFVDAKLEKAGAKIPASLGDLVHEVATNIAKGRAEGIFPKRGETSLMDRFERPERKK